MSPAVEVDLFGQEPAPVAATAPRAPRVAHTCPGCGRRTYRRIRRMPALGRDDARCQRCVDLAVEVEQARQIVREAST